MATNKKNLEMFKLEDRVLFDAAAAVEIEEAAQQTNDPNPNAQQSETDRQAKEDRETLKNAGPVDGNPADAQQEGAPVYDGGIADVDAASEALINGDVGALSEYFNKPVMTRVTIDPASQASLSSLADDSLVIVDATLPGSESLLASAEQQGRDVLVLDQDDGLDDVLAYLQNTDKEYGSFHFFSHANKAGVIKLGADTITDDNIQAAEWREIGEYLTDDGDIMFYGCELGQNGAGRTVARQIAELANADVAVSDDITGVHGDWELEYQIGDVNHEIFIPDNYDYDLAGTKIVTVEVAEDALRRDGDAAGYIYDGQAMNLREAIEVVNNDFYGTEYGFYEENATDETDQSLKYCDLVAHRLQDGNIEYYTLVDELHDEAHGERFYAYVSSDDVVRYWNVTQADLLAENYSPDTLKVLEVSTSGTSVVSFTIGKLETGKVQVQDVGDMILSTGNIIEKVSYAKNVDFGATYEICFAGAAQTEANVLKWELDSISRDYVTINGEGKAVIAAAAETNFSIVTNKSVGLTLSGLEITDAGKSAIYNAAGFHDLEDEQGVVKKVAFSLTVQDTLFRNNDADQGGAIYNEAGAGLTLRNATFSGNTADEGGAIYLADGGDLTNKGATFEYNRAGEGGAIYLADGDLTVDGNYHFKTNAAATNGGAIYSSATADLVITGGDFIGNYQLLDALKIEGAKADAISKGGAIYDAKGTIAVNGGFFEGNMAGFHTADGNLLYVIDGADFGVNGDLYQVATDTGDFVRVLDAQGKLVGLITKDADTNAKLYLTLTIDETVVPAVDPDTEDKTVYSVSAAKDQNGEDVKPAMLTDIQKLFNNSDKGQKLFVAKMSKVLVGAGGAIYTETSDTPLTPGAAKFISNLAKEGGALFSNRDFDVGQAYFEGNEAADKGGALYLNAVNLNAVNLTVGEGLAFKGNRADFGGAIYTSEVTRSVVLKGSVLNPVLFKDNAAVLDGGAICFAEGVAKIDLTYVTFDGNSAERDGGALYTPSTAAVAFKYTTFVGNEAERDGGALYANGSNYSFTRTNTFTGNKAGKDGGAVKLASGSVATMTDVVFEKNVADGKGGAVSSDDAVLTVANVTFKGNVAAQGGAVHIISGKNKDAVAAFNDSTFTDNSADMGGAMYLEMNEGTIQTVVKIEETSFSGNSALSFGGAIYNGLGVKAVVKNSAFTNNLLLGSEFDFEAAMKDYVLVGDNLTFIESGKENVFTAMLAGAAIANAGSFTSYQNAFVSNKGSESSVKYYNNDKDHLVEYKLDAATGALILPVQTIKVADIDYTLTRTSDTEISVTYIEPADPADPKAKDTEVTFTYTLDEATGDITCSEPTKESLFDGKVIRNQLAYRNLDGSVFEPEQWRDIADDATTPDVNEEVKNLYWASGDLGDEKKADAVTIVQLKAATAGGAFATIADKAVTSLVSNTLFDNAAGFGGAMYQGGAWERHYVVNGVEQDASSSPAMPDIQVNVVDTTIAGNTSHEETGYAFQSVSGKAMFLNAVIAANQRGKSDGALDFEVVARYDEKGNIVYDVGEKTYATLDALKTAFFAGFETGTGDISAAGADNLKIYYSVLGEFSDPTLAANYIKTDDNGAYLTSGDVWKDADLANVSVSAKDVQLALWQALFTQYETINAGKRSKTDLQDATLKEVVQTQLEVKQLAQNQLDIQTWYDAMVAQFAELEVPGEADPATDGYSWLTKLFADFKDDANLVKDSNVLRAKIRTFVENLEKATVAPEGGEPDTASIAAARQALSDALLATPYVETDVNITVQLGGDYGTTAMFDLVFGKTKSAAAKEISDRTAGEALTYDKAVISVDNLKTVEVKGLTDEERSEQNIVVGEKFTADRATNYIGTDISGEESVGTLSDRVYAEGKEAPVDEFGLTRTEKTRVFTLETDSSSKYSISPAAYYQSALVKISSDDDGAIIAVAHAKPVEGDVGVVYHYDVEKKAMATVDRIRATDAVYTPVFGGGATDVIDVDQRNVSSTFFNYTRGSWWQDGGAKLIEALVVTQEGDETGWHVENGLTFAELIYGIENGRVEANIDLDQDGVYEGYKITFDESLFSDGKYTMSVKSAFVLNGKNFDPGTSYNLVIDGGSDPARELTIEAGVSGIDFIDATNAALAFNLQFQHLTISGFKTAVNVSGTTTSVTNYYSVKGGKTVYQKLYSTVTVEDTSFSGSDAGAIVVNKGSVYVIGDSAFTNNKGGAISVGEGKVVLGIAEGIDADHTVTYGTPDTITFSGNENVMGGAICVTQAAYDADSEYQLAKYTAGGYAGIYMEGVQSVVFLNNTATSEAADQGGGALWVNGNIDITANQIDITGNTTKSNRGGSIYATGDVSLQLYGSSRLSTISGNKVVGTTTAQGGAIYAGGKATIGSKAAGAFFNIDANTIEVSAAAGITAQGGAIWADVIELKDVTSVVGNGISGKDADGKVVKISGDLTAQGGAFYAKSSANVEMTIAEVEGYWSDNSIKFDFADGGTGTVIVEGGAIYSGGTLGLSDVYAYKNQITVNLGDNGSRSKLSVLGGFAAAKGSLSFYSGEISQSRITATASGALKNATIAGGALYAGGDLELSHTTNTETNNATGRGVSSNAILVNATVSGGVSDVVISGGAAHAEGKVEVRNAKVVGNFVTFDVSSNGLSLDDVTVQGGAVASGKGGNVIDSALNQNYLIVDANGGSGAMKFKGFAVRGGAVALGSEAGGVSEISNVYAEDNYLSAKFKAQYLENIGETDAIVIRGGQIYAGNAVKGGRLTVDGSHVSNTLGVKLDGYAGEKLAGFNERNWLNLTAEGGGAYFGGGAELGNVSLINNNINVDLLNMGKWAYLGQVNLHGGQLAANGSLSVVDEQPVKLGEGASAPWLISPSQIVNARAAAIRLSGTSFTGGLIDTIDVKGGGAYANGDVTFKSYGDSTFNDVNGYGIKVDNNDIVIDIDSKFGDVMARNNGMGLFAEMAMQMLAHTKFNVEIGIGSDSELDKLSATIKEALGGGKVAGWVGDALGAALKLVQDALNLSRFNFAIDNTDVQGGGIYGAGNMTLKGVNAQHNDISVSYDSGFSSGTTRFILDKMTVQGGGVAAGGDLTVDKSAFNNNSLNVHVKSESSNGSVISVAFGILGVGKTSTSAGLAFLQGLDARGGGAYAGGKLEATDSQFNYNKIDVDISCKAENNTASGIFTWLDSVPGFPGIIVNMINSGAIIADSDALLWMDYAHVEGGGAYAGGVAKVDGKEVYLESVLNNTDFIGNSVTSTVLTSTKGSSAIANSIVTKLQYLTEDQKLGIGHKIDGVNSESIATADADVIVEQYEVRGGGFFTNGSVNISQGCHIKDNTLSAQLIADASGGCVTATSIYLQALTSNTVKPVEFFTIRLGAESTAHKDAYLDELRSITAYVPVLPVGGGADGFLWRVDTGFYGRPMVQGPFFEDGASGWWLLDGATFVVQGAGFDCGSAGYKYGGEAEGYIEGNKIIKADAQAITGCVPIAITTTSFFLIQLPAAPYPIMVPLNLTVDIDIEVTDAHMCAYNYFHETTSYGQFTSQFKVDAGFGGTIDPKAKSIEVGILGSGVFYMPGLTITSLPLHGCQLGGFIIVIPWPSMLGPVPMVFVDIPAPPLGLWATYTSNGILYLPMTPAAAFASLIDLGVNSAVALVANSVVSIVTHVGGFCEGAVPETASASGASTGGDASGAKASAGATVTGNSMTFKRAIVDKDGNVTGYEDFTVDLSVLALVSQAAGIQIANGSAKNEDNDKSTTRARDVKNETGTPESFTYSEVLKTSYTLDEGGVYYEGGTWYTASGDELAQEAKETIYSAYVFGEKGMLTLAEGGSTVEADHVCKTVTINGTELVRDTVTETWMGTLPTMADGTACFSFENMSGVQDGNIYIKDGEGHVYKQLTDAGISFEAHSLDGTTAFWDANDSKWVTADVDTDEVELNADGTMTINGRTVGEYGAKIYSLDGDDYWYDYGADDGSWREALPAGYKTVDSETGCICTADKPGDQVIAKSAAAGAWINLTTGEIYGTRTTSVDYAKKTVTVTYNRAGETEPYSEEPVAIGTGYEWTTYDANLNPIVTKIAENGDLTSTAYDPAKNEFNVTENSCLSNADGSYATTNRCYVYGVKDDGSIDLQNLKDETYVTVEVDADGQMTAMQQVTKETKTASFEQAVKDGEQDVYIDTDGDGHEDTLKTEEIPYDFEVWHIVSMDGFAGGSAQNHTSDVQMFYHYVDADSGNECYVPTLLQVPAAQRAAAESDTVYLLVSETEETVSPSYTDEQLEYIGNGDYYEKSGDSHRYVHEIESGGIEVDGKHYEFQVEGSTTVKHWQPLTDPAGDYFICEGFDVKSGTTGIDRTTGYPEGVLCQISTVTDMVKTGAKMDDPLTGEKDAIDVTKEVSSTSCSLVTDADGHQIHVKTAMIDVTDDDVDNPEEFWVVVGGEHDGETYVNCDGNPITDGNGQPIFMSPEWYGKDPASEGYVGPATVDGRPAIGYGETDSNVAFTYDKDGNKADVIWYGKGYDFFEEPTENTEVGSLDRFYDITVGQTWKLAEAGEVANAQGYAVIHHDAVLDTSTEPPTETTPAWDEPVMEDIKISFYVEADGTLRGKDGVSTFDYVDVNGVKHTAECCVLTTYVMVENDGATETERQVVLKDGKPVVCQKLDGKDVIQLGQGDDALYITEDNYGVKTTTAGYVGPATADGNPAWVGEGGNVLTFDQLVIDDDGTVISYIKDSKFPANKTAITVDMRMPEGWSEYDDVSALAGKAVYVRTVKDGDGNVYQEIIVEQGEQLDKTVQDPVTKQDKVVKYYKYTEVDTFHRDVMLSYDEVTGINGLKSDGKDGFVLDVATTKAYCETEAIAEKTYKPLYKADDDTLDALGITIKADDTYAVIVEVDASTGLIEVNSDGLPSNLVYNASHEVETDLNGHVIYSSYQGIELTVRTNENGDYIYDSEGGASYSASVDGYTVVFTTGKDGFLNVGEGGFPTEVEAKMVKTEVSDVLIDKGTANERTLRTTDVDAEYSAVVDGNNHIIYSTPDAADPTDDGKIELTYVLAAKTDDTTNTTTNTSYVVSVPDNVAAYLVYDSQTGKLLVNVAQDENGNAVYDNAVKLAVEQVMQAPENEGDDPIPVVSEGKYIYEIKSSDGDPENSVFYKDFYGTGDEADRARTADANAGFEKFVIVDKDGNARYKVDDKNELVKDSSGNPIALYAHKNLTTGLIYDNDGIVINALTDKNGNIVYNVAEAAYTLDDDGNVVCDAAGNVIYTASELTLGGVTVENAQIEVGVDGKIVSRQVIDVDDKGGKSIVEIPTCLMTIAARDADGNIVRNEDGIIIERYAKDGDGLAIYTELDENGNRYLDEDGTPSNVLTDKFGEPVLDGSNRAIYIALDSTGKPQLDAVTGLPANVENLDEIFKVDGEGKAVLDETGKFIILEDAKPVQYLATDETGRLLTDRAGNTIRIETDPATNKPLYDENHLPTTVLKRENGTMVYDESGHIIYLTTDADGLPVWIAYDADGQVINPETEDPENPTPVDHYMNDNLLTSAAITVDKADDSKGVLDLGDKGQLNLIKNAAGIWYIDVTGNGIDPKDIRLEVQTFVTDHGTFELLSDGYGNVLYRTSDFTQTHGSKLAIVPQETLETPYNTTSHDYVDGDYISGTDVYVTKASGKNDKSDAGSLAWALDQVALGKGTTIKFVDGLFTGGKAMIVLEQTLEIAAANVKFDAGKDANGNDRELVIRTAEPGLWFAAGYQNDSQQWLEANDAEGQNEASYVMATSYSLFNVTTANAEIVMSNITLEGGHAKNMGAAINAVNGGLKLTLDGSNIFRCNSDGAGGAIFVNGDLGLVLSDNAQLAVNNGQNGGAVYANGNVTIEGDGMFVRNTAEGKSSVTDSGNGGAIVAHGSVIRALTANTDELEFVANVAKNDGGAIYSEGGKNAALSMTEGVKFALNTATEGQGGAIYFKTASGATNITVDEVRFLGNEAGEDGGALYLEAATRENRMDIKDADFTGNKAGKRGGAVFFATTGTLTDKAGKTVGAAEETFVNAENTRFDSNIAGTSGGAIESGYGRITLKGAGTLVTDNAAGISFDKDGKVVNSANGIGGGINANGVVTIGKGVMFDGNAAGKQGGAIALSGGQLSVTSATFDGNASHGEGGAIALVKEALAVTIINSAFMVNNATNAGGAIYSNANEALILNRKSTFNANSVGKGDGGAVAIAGGEYQASGNIYFANRAANGSGGAISVSGAEASMSVKNVKFYDSVAGEYGGAVFAGNGATAEIANAVFDTGKTVDYKTSTGKGNEAKYGGAVAVTDGAKMNLVSNGWGSVKFNGNTASQDGGAVYVNSAELALNGEGTFVFNNNVAGGNGGAIFGDNAKITGTQASLEIVGGQRTKLADDGKTEKVVSTDEATNGGAIYLANGSNAVIGGDLKIDDVQSKGNGGAVYLADSSLTVKGDLTVANSTAAGNGGAVYATTADGKTSLTIGGKTVLGKNTAKDGGALSLGGTAKVAFNGETTIVGNEATLGGAVYFGGSSHIDFNATTTVIDNKADTGAAFYVGTTGEFSIDTRLVTTTGNHGIGTFYIGETTKANFRNASFWDATGSDYIVVKGYLAFNRSSIRGGGIHVLEGGQLAIANSTITEAEAVFDKDGKQTMSGYGLVLDEGAEAAIVHTTIAKNEGGLKIADTADALVLNSIFVGNANAEKAATDTREAVAETYDIVGTTRGGAVYYTVAAPDASIANDVIGPTGARNVVGRTFAQTFYNSGIKLAPNGTWYYMPKTETPAQEKGTKVSGGTALIDADGKVGHANYVDKYAGNMKGVANIFAGDITYDQRGIHRYENSFGAVIETQNILNEDSVSGVNNNGYTIVNGMKKSGGLSQSYGEYSSNMADTAKALSNSSVMGYGTNGGDLAFNTIESVLPGSGASSAYAFEATEASVLLANKAEIGVLDGEYGDEFSPELLSLAQFANLYASSDPIGGLARIEALRDEAYKALEEALREE